MADRAQVTSVEAIETFRADLIVYLSKARPTLEEVCNEVVRTRMWLQNDATTHWEQETKLRRRELDRAEQELFGARLSTIQEPSAAQQMAVLRARRAIRDAEEKLMVLKKWNREIENRTEPLVKLVDQLHHYMTTDMAKAVAYLTEVVRKLEAYTGATPPVAPSAASGTEPARAETADESSEANREAS